MAVLSFLIMSGALAASLIAMVAMIRPQWRRVMRLATGHAEPSFMPLQALAMAERRIAVRHWASAPARSVPRDRAAA